MGNVTPGRLYTIGLDVGTWQCIFPTTTYAQLSISTNAIDNSISHAVQGGLVIVRIVTVTTGSQTWYLYANSSPSVTVTNHSFNAYRIG